MTFLERSWELDPASRPLLLLTPVRAFWFPGHSNFGLGRRPNRSLDPPARQYWSKLQVICLGRATSASTRRQCWATSAQRRCDPEEAYLTTFKQRWQPLEDKHQRRALGPCRRTRGRRALVGGGHHGCKGINLFQVQDYLYRTVLDHLY